MKPRLTFKFSLCLNLALAGVAVWLSKKTVSPPSGAVEATASPATTALMTSSKPASTNSPASVSYVTNHFEWSRVETEDFEQLAQNLRAIGCPEKTVRDLVVARGRRALDQVSKESEPKLAFWTAGQRRARAQAEAERQERLAQEKITARLERALGLDVFLPDPKMMGEFESQAIMRFMLGPLPEETYQKVVTKMARFHERSEALDARMRGVALPADEAELAELQARLHRELAAALPRPQLEELTARLAMIPQMDEVKFEATDLTLAEVRQLGLIRARISDPFTAQGLLDSDSLTEAQEEALKTAQRQFLGEARFAQLERAADSDFQTLFRLGQDENLPREAAVKVFDLRQLTAQEVTQLRQDKSLSDEDRRQRLAQMQSEVQQAALQVLGASASAQYLTRGGAWLTNLTILPCNCD